MSDVADHAAESSSEALADARRLLNTATQTRGGGWSLENLLDAVFLSNSALLRVETEKVQQNVEIIGLLERLVEGQRTEGR
ncbi:MAG: hypothetical protein WCI34_07500 [Actinomycetes bacterium]